MADVSSENDNAPEFSQTSIELKFRDNVPSGYRIPFPGAMDRDEGRNGEIRYVLDCSMAENRTESTVVDGWSDGSSSSKECFPLFQLEILSQPSSSLSPSSSAHYDRLALKFVPSAPLDLRSEYRLQVHGIDQGPLGREKKASMHLLIRIERSEQAAKFSLSEYEFVVTSNGSMERGAVLGRVYAIGTDPSQVIRYQLVSSFSSSSVTPQHDMSDFIRINAMTGELMLANDKLSTAVDEVRCLVRASHRSNDRSGKMFTSDAKVRLLFRYVSLLTNVSYRFDILGSDKGTQVRRLNDSNTFVVDEDVAKDTDLFRLVVQSRDYPLDRYLLSLNNYLNTFSLISSSDTNTYVLRTRRRRRLITRAIYMLKISVKHKLSQHLLSTLRIEVIVRDASNTPILTTSTTTTTTTILTTAMTTTTTSSVESVESDETVATNSAEIDMPAELCEWCAEDRSYTLMDAEGEQMGRAQVIGSSSTAKKQSGELTMQMINGSEVMVGDCRMHIDPMVTSDSMLNGSSSYRLCPSPSSSCCQNVTWKDGELSLSASASSSKSRTGARVGRRWFGSAMSMQMGLVGLSTVFLVGAVVLAVLICRLKGVNPCVIAKDYLFYSKKYGLSGSEPFSYGSTSKPTVSVLLREREKVKKMRGMFAGACAFDRHSTTSIGVVCEQRCK